jgi:hypothetical protein
MNAARAMIIYCIVDHTGLGARILAGGGRLPCALTLTSSILSGGAYSILADGAILTVGGVLARNASTAGVYSGTAAAMSASQFASSVFDNCTIGFWSREEYSGGPSNIAIGLNSVAIKNCATAAVELGGPMSGAYMNDVVGAGNGVGIRLTHGSFVGVMSIVTLKAIEVEIDGVATTLAAMRAATPRIIRDTKFDSRIYELS